MNEQRNYQRDPVATTPTPEPVIHEVYQETVVNQIDSPGVATTGEAVVHERSQERHSGPGGVEVSRTEHVSVPSKNLLRRIGVTRVKQVIYFAAGLINVLLLLRFTLFLFAANAASGFVALIYGLSSPLAMPFQGMFAEPVLGASVFEWAALVAIAIYSLAAYGIVRIVALVYAPSHPLVTPN